MNNLVQAAKLKLVPRDPTWTFKGSKGMISVTILTGQNAGKTVAIHDNTDPAELLGGFAKENIEWSVDYSNATEKEALDWRTADTAARGQMTKPE